MNQSRFSILNFHKSSEISYPRNFSFYYLSYFYILAFH